MAWFRPLGVNSVDYHRRTVVGRDDDHPGCALPYYASRGETPLRWGGGMARRLGLSGAVDDASYEAVFGPGGARHPRSGERLVATRRPGVELVVAAHKSVAMLGLLGRAEDLHAILDAETDATLAFLERWFRRQGGRRGRAQRRTGTEGLLWARTRLATSRAGDPNPHDHVLVANLVEMADGRGGHKALDTAALRDLLHVATMVGRHAAAAEAVRRGYAIEADAGPSGRLDHWRIAAIPTVLEEVFSKRSADIDAEVSSAGFDSPQARGVAARRSRGPKSHDAPESLVARWLGELDAAGWPARRLVQRLGLVDQAHRRPLRRLDDEERQALAAELLAYEGPLAARKAFTRADVARHAAPRLYGTPPEELDALVEAVVAHAEAIPLVGRPAARSRAWTPASVLATEAAVESVAERLADRGGAAAVPAAVVEAAVARKEATLGRRLTAGQHRAAVGIATSGRALELVVGVAGSGKTTALDAVRAAYEAAGYRLLGTAMSGQAARALGEGAGIESRTVASMVWRLEHRRMALDARSVLAIDEAGMADDRNLLHLLAAVDAAGAKAVLVGDHRQLGAVEPGGGLEALVARHGPAVHVLEENVRQRDPAERAALEQLRAGTVAVAVDWYAERGRITTASERSEALDAAVATWEADVAAGRDSVLLAWRRRDVAALNQRARRSRIESGAVRGPELEAPGGRRYAAGDLVVTLAPDAGGRWVTSERATVTGVERGGLRVRFGDRRSEVLRGDDLDAEHLDHAYALTVHRVQGATVDRAHVLADGGGRELAYVAMSRARESSQVYAVADTTDQAVEDLTAEWGTDRRRRWVTDLNEPAVEGRTRRPCVARSTSSELRSTRLRRDRDAVMTVPQTEDRPRLLDPQLQPEQVAQQPAPRRKLRLGR